MRYQIFALIACLGLAACSPMIWDKPGVTPAEFSQDSARCRLVAHGMNPGDFYAQGTPGFVAGASLGNAIGTAIATRASYKDCMEAVGYSEEAPQVVAAGVSMKPVIAALKMCLTRIYTSPAAAPIAAHAPLLANIVTPAQLADSAYATPDEIATLTTIGALQKRCQQTALRALSNSEPSVVPILSATMAATATSREMLEARRITWGEYNTQRRNRALATTAQVVAELQESR